MLLPYFSMAVTLSFFMLPLEVSNWSRCGQDYDKEFVFSDLWFLDLAEFKIRKCKIFSALSFFSSCINIFSFYKMYVLIQFELLCQNAK